MLRYWEECCALIGQDLYRVRYWIFSRAYVIMPGRSKKLYVGAMLLLDITALAAFSYWLWQRDYETAAERVVFRQMEFYGLAAFLVFREATSSLLAYGLRQRD